MVQTRRATQLAATGGPKGVLTSGEHTTRPRKRAKNAHQPAKAVESRLYPALASRADTHTAHDAVSVGEPPKRARKDPHPTPPPSEFAPRAASPWKVGAHVSAAGGVANAVVNAARVRANAFALFVKSQRKWASPALTPDQVARFKARMAAFGYAPTHVLPHGSYLINLGNPDGAKRDRSYACFVDDLERCARLELVYYNFHPGSTVGNATKDESIALIAECLNRAHKDVPSVITVIENMSGAKNIIGSQFTELRDIIAQVEDKTRVGVCLDTCHLYAAGYDISTKAGWDATVATFDEQIGLSYLRGMHLNDSKTPLGSKKDRHENIGLGTLGLAAFHNILTDPRVQNIPLILETPTFEAVEVWEREIDVLNKLSEVGTGVSGEKSRGEMLNELVGDIRSVVWEYRDKEKVGKKNTSARKAKSRKRKAADDGDDEEASHSDTDESCTEQP